MKTLIRLFRKTALVFDLRRPQFRRLDFIDIVLENKLLLLLSWDIAHATKIRIRPGKAYYRNTCGAAICKLPMGAESVDIRINNLWRATTISLPLKRITVDKEVLHFLNQHFVAPPFTVTAIQPALRLKDQSIVNLIPQVNLPTITTCINISINHQQLSTYVS